MQKDLLIASIGFSLFIICPRMAGMAHIITKHSNISLFYTALLGGIISIPLVLLMVFIFGKFGIFGALAFCILTDILSALFMKEINFNAGVETLIIALFVILGVKVAPYITNFFQKFRVTN
jgi:hypothetical protein